MSVFAVMAVILTLIFKSDRFFTFNIAALSALTGYNVGTLLYILAY